MYCGGYTDRLVTTAGGFWCNLTNPYPVGEVLRPAHEHCTRAAELRFTRHAAAVLPEILRIFAEAPVITG